MTDSHQIAQAFERLSAPVFLARATDNANGRLITLHTTERRGTAKIALHATSLLKREGIDAKCHVVSHSARALRRARSLEGLSGRFGSGEIVYDPTHFVGRSEAVVECAKRLRAELGAAVRNIHLDVRRRTLYIIVRDDAGENEQTAMRADLVRRVGQVMRDWQVSRAPGFDLAARIGTTPPRDAQLVSVDNLSMKRALYSYAFERKQFVRGAVAMGMAAIFGASLAVPAAAREPAVSSPNYSVMVRGGSVSDEGEADFGVKGAFGLGEEFGVQGELGIGTNDYYGIGGHVFWRDPETALIGVFASHEGSDGVEMTRFGAEAELYVHRVTFGGRVGSETNDIEDGAFGRVDVTYYAEKDLALRVGGEFTPDIDFGRAGVEWRPALDSMPQLSVFADAEFGHHDHDLLMAGLRMHFGAPGVTLMDRDRREDPWWLIFNRVALIETPHGYGPVSNTAQ
jgi:hypothetical protein